MEMLRGAFRRVPEEGIYFCMGIRFVQLNILYQLLAVRVVSSPIPDIAEVFLMMPDLFNSWLAGVKASEFSEAITSQFYNPIMGDRDRKLPEKMGVPSHFLQEIVPSRTVLGGFPLR
jgi:sugar (pentulose or hexulose) kinase